MLTFRRSLIERSYTMLTSIREQENRTRSQSFLGRWCHRIWKFESYPLDISIEILFSQHRLMIHLPNEIIINILRHRCMDAVKHLKPKNDPLEYLYGILQPPSRISRQWYVCCRYVFDQFRLYYQRRFACLKVDSFLRYHVQNLRQWPHITSVCDRRQRYRHAIYLDWRLVHSGPVRSVRLLMMQWCHCTFLYIATNMPLSTIIAHFTVPALIIRPRDISMTAMKYSTMMVFGEIIWSTARCYSPQWIKNYFPSLKGALRPRFTW